MFQLSENDLMELSLSQNVIAMQTRGIKGGRSVAPYAFTEQGVYMLMTVLKGELAVKQSRALVMAFKEMKDYIFENRGILEQKEQLKMMALVAESNQQVGEIKKEMTVMDKRLVDMEAKMEGAVMKDEISPMLLNFNKVTEREEYIFMNGELMKAREVYQEIYEKAEKNIMIIDDYIDIRTLRLLSKAQGGVEITIFSDNVRNYLYRDDYEAFKAERPDVKIEFITTRGVMHDRFILVDYGEKGERIYHCGASSKDAGKKVTVITEVVSDLAKRSMRVVVDALMRNPKLVLK